MAYVPALLLFVALSAACWFASVALYRGTVATPDPTAAPGYRATTALAVGAVAVTSFVPFLGGYLMGQVVWAAAAFGGLGLPPGRAAVLFLYLAVTSLLARMVVLGVMDLFGI